MSEEVHVEIELPATETREEPAPEVVVVETGTDSAPGTSDGTLTALLDLQRQVDELSTENASLHERVASAEVTATSAAISIENVAEETATEITALSEEVAEAQSEPEPDLAPRRTHWTEFKLWGR